MALVDVDSWLTEFEACCRLNHTLLSQLNQRDNKQHLSADYNRFTSSIQVGLKQFEREVQQLKFKLNETAKAETITSEEIERRQRQLDTLQSQRLQLQRKYTESTRNDRAALLKNPSTSSNWQKATKRGDEDNGEESDAAPIIDTHDLQALKQHEIDMLEQQNRGLDTLSQTLSRQRVLATQLGQEVEDQNDILDNLANTIERVETGVSLETRNISLVNRRDKTWGYWLIIIGLFIAIIVVGVI